MKKIFLPVTTLLFLCAFSCGPKESPLSKEAKEKGVVSAQVFLNVDTADEMALQKSLLDAKVVESHYRLIKDTLAANDFEEAFLSYVKAHNAQLASRLHQ